MYLNKAALTSHCLRVFAAIGILATISIFFLDQRLTRLFKEDDWKWILARETTDIGLVENFFVPALILWISIQLLIKWKKSANLERLKYTGTRALWLMYCFAFAGFFTHLLKFFVGRQRPKVSAEFDPHVFKPFTISFDNSNFLSFPSGHSQVLFTVATFLAFIFPKYTRAFYFVAFIMAFTRVMTRDHFYSDVLVGVAVGHISTVVLLYWLLHRNPHKSKA